MDTQAIDRVLSEMSADDAEDALRVVEILEADGSMEQAHADEWRRRVAAWRRFAKGPMPPVEN